MQDLAKEAKTTASRVMTKEEVQTKTDDELFAMYSKAQGHTKDFQSYMRCDFSYSYLVSLIKKRGYEDGWHKVGEGDVPKPKAEWIQMNRPKGEVSRQTYKVPKDVAAEWKSFNEDLPYNSVVIGAAMKRFMDDYRGGLVKFIYTID